jgi:anaerobic glycerol-3-phosphate dehydrogenase
VKKQIDVLVIGGGVAGAVAAAQAAAAGLKVVQVRKSMGASAYSSGAVDVADSKLDEIPGPGADPFSRGEGWLKAAQDLTSKKLRHPFARARDGLARLENGLALFADLAKDVNLVAREDGHNHVLVTQMGTLKRSALVQRSQLSDLSELTSGECVGIVEISGLLGFDAEPVAKMLKWMMKLANRPGFEVVPVRVDFMRPDGKHWRSPWEWRSNKCSKV